MPYKNKKDKAAWFRRMFDDMKIITFGGRCFHCGAKERGSRNEPTLLEFAHIEPTGLNGRGRGQSARVYDIKNNQDKYILLCGQCHSEFDWGGGEEVQF